MKMETKLSNRGLRRFYFGAPSPCWRAKAPRNPQNASTVLNLDADIYKPRYEVACSAFTIHALLFICLANAQMESLVCSRSSKGRINSLIREICLCT